MNSRAGGTGFKDTRGQGYRVPDSWSIYLIYLLWVYTR